MRVIVFYYALHLQTKLLQMLSGSLFFSYNYPLSQSVDLDLSLEFTMLNFNYKLIYTFPEILFLSIHFVQNTNLSYILISFQSFFIIVSNNLCGIGIN